MGIENKLLTLKLNKFWQACDETIVADALIDLAGGENSYALDIDYELKENGEPDTSNPISIRPVTWDEWITLPIRSWDLSIRTVKLEIRVPRVLVCKNYEGMPMVKFGRSPSSDQIRLRDNNVCQYTGRKLKREEVSIDHVVPRSRGGDNSWHNLAVTSKDINTKKGNSLNEEIGLKLIRKPTIPKPMPRYKLIRSAKHFDWKHFLDVVEE